jgi:hypothetical protein
LAQRVYEISIYSKYTVYDRIPYIHRIFVHNVYREI